jgi:hypothetical protein
MNIEKDSIYQENPPSEPLKIEISLVDEQGNREGTSLQNDHVQELKLKDNKGFDPQETIIQFSDLGIHVTPMHCISRK